MKPKIFFLFLIIFFSLGSYAQEFQPLGHPVFSSCDFDNDGDMDVVYVGTDKDDSLKAFFYENLGNKKFKLRTDLQVFPLNEISMAWGDYDNDGYKDLFICGTVPGTDRDTTILYKNNSATSLVAVSGTNLPGMDGYGANIWFDYNSDGKMDIIHGAGDTALIFSNNGDGTFTAINDVSGIFPGFWGGTLANIDTADINHDGYMDIILGSYLYKNNGDGTFTFIHNYNYDSKFADIDTNGFVDVIYQQDYINSSLGTHWFYIIANEIRGDTNYLTDTVFSFHYFDGNTSYYFYPLVVIDREPGLLPDILLKVGIYDNNNENTIYSLKNLGNRTFSCDSQSVSKFRDLDFVAFDFNNDHLDDILILGEYRYSYSYTDVSLSATRLISAPYINMGSYFAYSSYGLNDTLFTAFSDIDTPYDYLLSADFDNDGKLDIALNNRHKMLFFKGLDNGTFGKISSRMLVASDGDVTRIADFNNDGLPDIMTFVNDYVSSNPGLYIYKNNGGFTFDKIIYPDSLFAYSRGYYAYFLARDINNDGNVDIISVGSSPYNAQQVIVPYKGNGNFSFQRMDTIWLGEVYVNECEWINFNGDQYPDILLNYKDNSLGQDVSVVYVNNGDFTFTKKQDIGLPQGEFEFFVYDYTGDGLDDVILGPDADNSRSKIFFINNGSGGFYEDASADLSNDIISGSSAIIDLKNAGYKSLIEFEVSVINQNNYEFTSELFDNIGGTLKVDTSFRFNPDMIVKKAIVSDFNNDGYEDMILYGWEVSSFASDITPRLKVYFNNHNGGFEQINYCVPGGNFLAGADIDRDGKSDVLVSAFSNNNFTLTGYEKSGNSFDKMREILSNSKQVARPVDFNNDGYVDLFVADFESDIRINGAFLKNVGQGKFVPVYSNISPKIFCSGHWGDFNNDGKMDLLYPGETDIFLNTSQGFMQEGVQLPNADAAKWIDFDKDDRKDVVLINSQNSKIEFYKHLDNNSFEKVFSYGLLLNKFADVYVLDYNNDGWQDVLVPVINMLEGANTFEILLFLNNNGTFSLPQEIFSEDFLLPLAGFSNKYLDETNLLHFHFGDFNNDGKIDFTIPNLIKNFDTLSLIAYNYYPDSLHIVYVPGYYNGDILPYDYNGDNVEDFIITGQKDGAYHTQVYVNKDTGNTINLAPTIPANLSFKAQGDTVFLFWSPATDDLTPQAALGYNIYVYEQDGDTIMNSNSDHHTGKLFIKYMGNVGEDTTWFITGLQHGKLYRWSVQAIDNKFQAGKFAPERVFALAPDFSVQPLNNTACEESEVIFSVIPIMADSLHWQVDTNNSGNFFDIQNNDYFENSTTPNLRVKNIPMEMDGWRFRCKAMNIGGVAYSHTAVLNVQKRIKAQAGVDTTICTDTITLYATNPSPATGQWSADNVSFADPGKYNTRAMDIPPGTTTLTWTVTQDNVCGSNSDKIIITRINPVENPTAPSGLSRCVSGFQDYSVIPVANAQGYMWRLLPDSVGVLLGQTDKASVTISWDDNFADTARLQVRAYNHCSVSNWSTPLQIVNLPKPDRPDTPQGETALCAGSNIENYTVSGHSDIFTYQWQLTPSGAGAITGNGNVISLSWSPGFSGQAQLRVREVGCEASDWSDPLLITVYPSAPQTPFSPSGPVDLCRGTEKTSYSVAGVDNAQGYQWALSRGGDSIAGTGINAIVYWQSGFYGLSYLKVRSYNKCGYSGWSDSLPIQVRISPSEPEAPSGRTEMCVGDLGSFTVNPVDYATLYRWAIYPDSAGEISGSSTTANIQFSTGFSGTAYLRVRAENNCGVSPWSDSLQISVSNPHPDSIIRKGDFMIISPDSGYVYQWYYDGYPIVGATQQYYFSNPLRSGTYQVQLTDDNGCKAFSPELLINPAVKSVLVYPNPAGKGHKIQVVIKGDYQGKVMIQLLSAQMQVIDRWDGKKGKDDYVLFMDSGHLSSGVYFLKIKFSDSEMIKKIIIN